jgi:hypothetical protein
MGLQIPNPKPLSLLGVAACRTVSRSRWCQSGVKRLTSGPLVASSVRGSRIVHSRLPCKQNARVGHSHLTLGVGTVNRPFNSDPKGVYAFLLELKARLEEVRLGRQAPSLRLSPRRLQIKTRVCTRLIRTPQRPGSQLGAFGQART